MKLIQMRYFSAACRLGTISQAAETMHVSQPAVTSAIRTLEDELGVPLLTRGKKKVLPTTEGEEFLLRCDAILNEVDKLEETYRERSEARHSIMVGIPPMIGYFLFPRIFGEFRRRYPYVVISPREVGSETAKELVRNGELELAIITMGTLPPPGLTASILMETELVYCVNRDHPLCNCTKIPFSEIGDDPLVLFSSGFYHTNLLRDRFSAENIKPNILFHSNQIMTIKAFVRGGLANAFLLPQVIDPADEIIPISTIPPLKLNVAIIHQRNAVLTKESRQIIQFVRSKFDA